MNRTKFKALFIKNLTSASWEKQLNELFFWARYIFKESEHLIKKNYTYY